MSISCTDELQENNAPERPVVIDKGIGQMVLFSAGNVGSATSTTRAAIPYMETGGRFVCTMYFHGNAGATETSEYDTEDENSRFTSYMKVFDVKNPTATGTESLGNSVYWKRDYSDLTQEIDLNDDSYRTYGFDPRVEPFYWKNRLPHVFVAYTDYNKLKEMTYSTRTVDGEDKPNQGALFMYPEADGVRKVKTGEKVNWIPEKMTSYSFSRNTMSFEAFNSAKQHQQFTEEQFNSLPDAAKLKSPATGETTAEYYGYDEYKALDALTEDQFNAIPDNLKFVVPAVWTLTAVNKDQQPVTGHHSSLSFNGSHHYSETYQSWLTKAKTDIETAINASTLSQEEKTALIADMQRTEDTQEEVTVNGTFHNSCWTIFFTVQRNIGYVDSTERGERINLSDSETTVFFSYEKKDIEEEYQEQPANTFDLTRRSEMTTLQDQPDPILEVTKIKPTGATQEANRVRLYFKHQFAQVQVNVQKVEDNTDDLTAENILSVELLGVTQKGYVFTLPNKNGEAIAPAYDPVDVSKLTPEQYAANRYGTSFNMFVMSDAEKPDRSLKSFNAIAFGELRALRVTWKEPEAAGGQKHVVIFPVDKDERGEDLKRLQSGKRYVYDIKMSRGMLASIRVTIEGWHLSEDLNYIEQGTIDKGN